MTARSFSRLRETSKTPSCRGPFPEETQIPSTTEISVTYQINPATVLKGMNLLVDEGILYKKRGVGMFVTQGATAQLRTKRKDQFYDSFVETMLTEAKRLEIQKNDLIEKIERGYSDERN
jgi:DNA-binding transcriptional regulator YhcF (GntR family)